mmetsp:Transcript_48582/g.152398  ORF Transcript_48582/g.152398 Transcript_48582/m.152398 type:complete len:83 (-) Transcript_48582:163-411(-)
MSLAQTEGAHRDNVPTGSGSGSSRIIVRGSSHGASLVVWKPPVVPNPPPVPKPPPDPPPAVAEGLNSGGEMIFGPEAGAIMS